jgi:hypothetical protein
MIRGGAFMDSEHRGLVRGGLLVLAATPLVGGLWALLFPRAFYDDFPLPGADWVSTLGPYNEHLVSDCARSTSPWRCCYWRPESCSSGAWFRLPS